MTLGLGNMALGRFFSLIFLFSPFCSWLSLAQAPSNVPEEIREDMDFAMELFEYNQPEAALVMLKKIDHKAPGIYAVRYEMAVAHYELGDYAKTIGILKELEMSAFVSDLLFQLEGNAYDMLERRSDALKTYDRGLERFPNSGRLYLEKGVCAEADEEYDKALDFYNKGIEVEPGFASCYYRAAMLYLSSSEPVLGLVYGEIFRILEPVSKRSSEISKLLFSTLVDHIKLGDSGSVSVSLSNDNVGAVVDGHMVLPFAKSFELSVLAYRRLPILLFKNGALTIFDCAELKRDVLKNLQSMSSGNFAQWGPVVGRLLSYEQMVADAGFWNAYCLWLLMYSDMEAMKLWMSQEGSSEEMQGFVAWISEHPFGKPQ